MKIISWNVNGIRAIEKKGFQDFLKKESPDILCIQETKASLDQLPETLANIEGYDLYISNCERKGYSGVCCYTKEKPLSVREGLYNDQYNSEGRVIVLEFPEFTLYNVYFPNGGASEDRRNYKNKFNQALLEEVGELIKEGKKVIITGDFNIAHEEIDLKNPKSNEKHSGFLPCERRFLDRLIDLGFVDSFRYLHPGEEKYSWWSYRFNARSIDAGWRIDYFFLSTDLISDLVSADILSEITGSDHAPVLVELDFQNESTS